MRQLPNESIIYFGDTARVPYGTKSHDTVLRYSRGDTSFLRDQGNQALVVACHTATAHALPTSRGERSPDHRVIEPGSRAAAKATRSEEWESSVRKHDQLARIRTCNHSGRTGCTIRLLLAVICAARRRRVARHPKQPLIAREYLTPIADQTSIPSCRLHSLSALKTVIGQSVGRDVRLIDSAEETAAETGDTA